MPCDGRTVMNYERQNRDQAAMEIVRAVEGLPVQAVDGCQIQNGSISFMTGSQTIKFAIMLPGKMIVKVAVEMGGRVTCITQGGTFEGGKAAMMKLIAQAVEAQGVSLSGLRFETHRHEKIAPKLAYATSRR